MVPPKIDQGPGLLVISPWVKKGTIDKQVLSHDAYLKFIEEALAVREDRSEERRAA